MNKAFSSKRGLYLLTSFLLLLSCLWVCVGLAFVLSAGPIFRTIVGISLERNRATAPPVPPEDLLVPLAAFPREWSYSVRSGRRLSEMYSAFDAAGQWYTHPNDAEFGRLHIGGPAFHAVARYLTVKRARQNFAGVVDYLVLGDLQEWRPPPNWDYTSTLADDYFFGCRVDHEPRGYNTERCHVIARYGPYISDFWVAINYTDMTYAELEKIMRAIDAEFAVADIQDE